MNDDHNEQALFALLCKQLQDILQWKHARTLLPVFAFNVPGLGIAVFPRNLLGLDLTYGCHMSEIKRKLAR